MTIKHAIQLIIDAEPDMQSKLDLLTSLAIDCTNDEIWRAAEDVRNELGEPQTLDGLL